MEMNDEKNEQLYKNVVVGRLFDTLHEYPCIRE